MIFAVLLTSEKKSSCFECFALEQRKLMPQTAWITVLSPLKQLQRCKRDAYSQLKV